MAYFIGGVGVFLGPAIGAAIMTLGGNLVTASQIGDGAPVMLSLDSYVVLASTLGLSASPADPSTLAGQSSIEIAWKHRVHDRLLKVMDLSAIDRTDGISVEFDTWRFNLRGSNTEPILRLNVESRGDEALMRRKTEELLAFIDAG